MTTSARNRWVGSGPYLPIEAVEHRRECADHRTPEMLLMAAEDAAEAQRAVARDMPRLRGLSPLEASVLTWSDGLCGQPRLSVERIAALLFIPASTVPALLAIARQRADRMAP